VSPPTSTVHNAAYERGARTVLALYANPATPEAVIRKHGLQTRQELLVALARQAKGQVLLTALIKALNSPRLMSQTERDTLMLPLLAEPALRARHLHAITAARTTIASTAHTALMGGLWDHVLLDDQSITNYLWGAPMTVAARVALTTGSLAASATNWVARGLDGQSARRPWGLQLTPAERARVIAVTVRWAELTTGQPALVAFVVTSAFTFTNEDDMFAAGRAITAPPAHHPQLPSAATGGYSRGTPIRRM